MRNDASAARIVHGQQCQFMAADGYPLHGHFWQSDAPPRAALLINAATGVVARYYHRYATWLAQHGFLVLTYDYRGIGASRPATLKGFAATKHDWGALDCTAAIQTLSEHQPGLPLLAVCHSIGGFALGLAANAGRVERALFVGCQYAYWRDYRLPVRPLLWLNWHLVMPLLTCLCGYFPGKRLGWLEDLPHGVAMEWATRWHPVFHRRYHRLPHAQAPAPGDALEARMAELKANILAIADARDPFATLAATEHLLACFPRSERAFATITPRKNGLPKLGHFGFFHDKFRASLWPQSLAWLNGAASPWPIRQHWPAQS